MSLLTVVYNPSVDEEWHLDELVWHERNLIKSQRSWAGGKGVNVARWLGFLGERTKLLLALGGPTGTELGKFLKAEGIIARVFRLSHATRRNVLVTLPGARQLRFNSPGPQLSSTEARRLLALFRHTLKRSTILILSGSLPGGVAAGTYARMIQIAARMNCRVLIDCAGEALRLAVEAGPFLVKPNEFELSEWWGRGIANLNDALLAATAMSKTSGGWVMVSRGADPSILTNAQEGLTWIGKVPRIHAINTLGAGDAMLAGAALEIVRGSAPAGWLKCGMASGSAATLVRPGILPARRIVNGMIRRVKITQHPGRT